MVIVFNRTFSICLSVVIFLMVMSRAIRQGRGSLRAIFFASLLLALGIMTLLRTSGVFLRLVSMWLSFLRLLAGPVASRVSEGEWSTKSIGISSGARTRQRTTEV